MIRVEADGGFVIEQINPTHEAQVGFRREEVAGRRIEEILPPELAAQVVGAYRRVVENGEIYQYREAYELRGELQHWDNALVPVFDADGRVARIFGSSRNVTRQVQAEEVLRQAQKMEAVGQLTGGIAHGFNNLLGALVGAFDLIRRKPSDPDRVRQLAEAGPETAERGSRLTSQLLTFSRSQQIELKPLFVEEVVEGMSDLLSRSPGPLVQLTFDPQKADRPVLSDRTQLEMALLNLAINARDAMPEGAGSGSPPGRGGSKATWS